MQNRTNLALVSALALSCAHGDQSALEEETGVATDAIVSAEFSIACEPGAVPAIAVNGTTALAAWAAADGTVHAARFDQNGNVLDATPIALDLPPPPTNYPITLEQTGLEVVRTATGFAVVGAFYSYFGAGQHDELLEYREVDLAGVPVGPWQLVYTYSHSTGATLPYIRVLQSGFDGTTAFVAIEQYTHLSPAYSQPWFRVFALGGGQVLQVPPVQNGVSWYGPTWDGFGCGPIGCLALWREPMTYVRKAQVIGQPAVTLATGVPGAVVGTPTGFLRISDPIVAFSPTGTPTAGPTPLVPFSSSLYPNVRAVFDGVASRAAWTVCSADIYSATIADETSIVAAPTAEVTAAQDPAQFALGTFGAERSVLVDAGPGAVVGRFIGDLPASVPAGCGMPGGGGSGAGGASDTGGAPSNGGSPDNGGSPGSAGAESAGGSSSGPSQLGFISGSEVTDRPSRDAA